MCLAFRNQILFKNTTSLFWSILMHEQPEVHVMLLRVTERPSCLSFLTSLTLCFRLELYFYQKLI